MSDLVEDFFSTPIPEKVWHYTSVSGFEGIVSSGRVWATEAHYTTDAAEFTHARDVATAFLQRIELSDESMIRARQAGLATVEHAFDNGPLSTSQTEVFVASFSSTSDLKSQWIEYADQGQGVSIAFDLREVRPPHGYGSAVTFAPCVYAQEKKEHLLEIALDHFINKVAQLYKESGSKSWVAQRLRDWKLVDNVYRINFDRASFEIANQEYFDQQLQIANTQTTFDLLRLASHCKSEAFHQENEWRLALPHHKAKPWKTAEVLYRGPNGNIPYLAHKLFKEKLPITEVLVGPLCENITRIEEILHTYGYTVPVTKSTIPLP